MRSPFYGLGVLVELIIGSNVIRNTSGVLTVQGKDQIFLEIDPESNQLLLTMDVYDKDGQHVAKLGRNAWNFNDQNAYKITTNPKELRLIERATGQVVVEANVTGDGQNRSTARTFLHSLRTAC